MDDKPHSNSFLHLTTTSSSSCSSTAASRTFSASLRRSTSATTPPTTYLPAGNICPSGCIGRTRSSPSARTDILRSEGSGSYGHGSVVRRTESAEEVKGMGNDMYKKGQFSEALRLYEKAISMSPENAAYRTNRAAALAAVGRVGEAVGECRKALRIDGGFVRAHQRLAALYMR